MKTKNKKGFTLLELLIVIGIIGMLSTTMAVSFSRMRKSAIQKDAKQLVSDVATAFTVLLENERGWPKAILDHVDDGMVPEVCWVFQKKKLLDVTTWAYNTEDGTHHDDGSLKTPRELSKTSLDRLGLLDPWAKMDLKKRTSVTSSTQRLANGKKTYKDHLIQYRVDKNLDGYVDSQDGNMPVSGLRVRASVIVWSRGEDGQDDSGGGRYPKDDVISWSMAERSAK